MVDRSLKGTGLGSKSFEDEAGVEFEPRRRIGYACPNHHQFSVVFAEEAEFPTGWTCPRCGREADRTDGHRHVSKEMKPGRTHWDMLRERRTMPDLEQLLAERLELLHAGKIGPTVASSESAPPHRSPGRKPLAPSARKGRVTTAGGTAG